jgi:hypothetical protein
MKLNLLQFGSFFESILGYLQNGWIDPNMNNISWNDSSFAHVDKCFGGIVGHGKLTIYEIVCKTNAPSHAISAMSKPAENMMINIV